MMLLRDIQSQVALHQFEFSEHALTQSILRSITVQEIIEAVATGAIIEDYPTDKYGPSVLLLGFTQQQRPIHIQCTYPAATLLKIITVYQPDPQRWIDYRQRR